MRLLIFFTISALFHSVLLALPSPFGREGKGEAIPVTLVLAGSQKIVHEEKTNRITNRDRLERTPRPIKRPDQFKKIKKAKKTQRIIQVRKALKKLIPKRSSPTIARRAKISPSKKIETARVPVGKRKSEAAPMPVSPVSLTALPDEIFDEAVEMEESSNSYPSESLAAKELWEEDPTIESDIEERDYLLASKPASEPKSVSPPPYNKSQGSSGHAEGQGRGLSESPFVRANYALVGKLEYPWKARRMGWEGTTLLRVLVDPKGKSKSVLISRSSGFESLDSAAVKAVKGWRFHPARYGTRPVESWVKIPIIFSLKDSDRNSLFVNR